MPSDDHYVECSDTPREHRARRLAVRPPPRRAGRLGARPAADPSRVLGADERLPLSPRPPDPPPSPFAPRQISADASLASSRAFARAVGSRTRRYLLLGQLKRFLADSQALPVAVGLVVGSAISKNADQFVASFVTPLLAAIAGNSHLKNESFSLNGAVFAWGAFVESVVETVFTIVCLFYLVVAPMCRLGAVEWSPKIACPECESAVSDTCRRCPHCAQPVVREDPGGRDERNENESR